MPPRTGPRRKKGRPKQTAPRHFAIIRVDDATDLVVAHAVELDDRNLVLRDENGAACHIIADGEWREIRPATIGDLPGSRPTATLPAEFAESAESAESAEGENEPVIPTEPPLAGVDRQVAVTSDPFVPSSPEEAQRILMELRRRLNPQDPDAPSVAPPPRAKE